MAHYKLPQNRWRKMVEESTNQFSYIRDNLSSMSKAMGIIGVLDLVSQGFRDEEISMYECHTLSHLIGHAAPVDQELVKQVMTRFGPNFCEGGFIHGVESEIVLSNPYDFQKATWDLCTLMTENGGINCFHGSGHTFMKSTLDLEKALSACDDLVAESAIDATDCYTGVFSELTNIVGGVDGDTGLPFTEKPPITLQSTAQDYCAGLSPEHQIPCAQELNGFGISQDSTPSDIARKLEECILPRFAIELQQACLQSVSAVGAQHLLNKNSSLEVPEVVLGFPIELRQAYIQGAGSEMSQFIKNGVSKDWQHLCGQFPQDLDQNSCAQFFEEL